MASRKNRERPKAKKQPKGETVRAAVDPNSYLEQTPVWRFSDFDWESSWGYESCLDSAAKLRGHIEQHLSSFETMTWGEILKATGGRRQGNNSHAISRDKFKPDVEARLRQRNVLADTLFSLRLDAGTRVYGVREGSCLRLVFFDPYHKDKAKCAYDF
ncbi:hypothetical protein I5L01_02795 [Erythrobacter sp. YJ-T3-07]|uniref:hypothetical protein n=1 Tax=Erythrobacter sp. YJ-T3-07 TaxID=2793063 RepID=UPI0018D3AD68|nr:hypothetical protein [Erythrobacter sp. YJ-T3-07]MBH1943152.1 hypothetical protein [Erythrobacter sp. YJ-T3-07]